jgi:protein involved in polysaccharide export with SLBB domain
MRIVILAALVASAFMLGCATSGVSTLAPGDEVEVRLIGTPQETTIRDLVDENGCIALPDLGERVHVAGKSTSEAERMIIQLYVDGGHRKAMTVVVQRAAPAKPQEK